MFGSAVGRVDTEVTGRVGRSVPIDPDPELDIDSALRYYSYPTPSQRVRQQAPTPPPPLPEKSRGGAGEIISPASFLFKQHSLC